jgi:DNA-binding transcriptional ArsR family regulator
MRLDPELVRALLMRIEATPANQMPDTNIEIDGYSEDEILEHLELLGEAGLIEANPIKSGIGPRLMHVHVERLTWAGHDFLNNARNDTVWKRARDLVAKQTGSVSIDVFKAVLVQVAKTTLSV